MLRLSLSPIRKRAAFAASGHFLPRHVVRSGGSDGEFRGEDTANDQSFLKCAAPSDDAKDGTTTQNFVGDHPVEVRKELMNLALPAIIGQAIDPLAQSLETAYIGCLAIGCSVSRLDYSRTAVISRVWYLVG